jgi:hypothetical protein
MMEQFAGREEELLLTLQQMDTHPIEKDAEPEKPVVAAKKVKSKKAKEGSENPDPSHDKGTKKKKKKLVDDSSKDDKLSEKPKRKAAKLEGTMRAKAKDVSEPVDPSDSGAIKKKKKKLVDGSNKDDKLSDKPKRRSAKLEGTMQIKAKVVSENIDPSNENGIKKKKKLVDDSTKDDKLSEKPKVRSAKLEGTMRAKAKDVSEPVDPSHDGETKKKKKKKLVNDSTKDDKLSEKPKRKVVK